MTPASNAPTTPNQIDPSPCSDKVANTIPVKAAAEATDKSKLPEIMSIVEGKAKTERTDTARRNIASIVDSKEKLRIGGKISNDYYQKDDEHYFSRAFGK